MKLSDELLEAVITAFNEKGIKFTMDDIAKYMGISKRTLYEMVEDKEALFFEMVSTVFSEIKKGELQIVRDSSLDSLAKLKKMLIYLPSKYQTIDFRQLYELKNQYPKIYAKIQDRLETDWETTFMLIKQAQKEGKIRNINLQVFKAVFTGSIEYYLSQKDLIESNITYKEALEQLLDILMEGILGSSKNSVNF